MLLRGPQDRGQQGFPLFQWFIFTSLSTHTRCRPRASTPCGIECQATFWPLISKSLSGPFALVHLKKLQLGPSGPEVGLRKLCYCSQLEAESMAFQWPLGPGPAMCHLCPSQPYCGTVGPQGHHLRGTLERLCLLPHDRPERY